MCLVPVWQCSEAAGCSKWPTLVEEAAEEGADILVEGHGGMEGMLGVNLRLEAALPVSHCCHTCGVHAHTVP